MKYFTREMWLGWQTDQAQEWFGLHKKNLRNYSRQLKKLEPRLNARAFKFFTAESLHDGSLVSMNITDRGSEACLAGRRSRVRPYPTDVAISVIHGEGKHLYNLDYSQVRKVDFDFPPQVRLFSDDPEGLGCWGYDELTSKGKLFLGHDILFESGAIISLEFKSMKIQRKKI
jgi:hypothetical protein